MLSAAARPRTVLDDLHMNSINEFNRILRQELDQAPPSFKSKGLAYCGAIVLQKLIMDKFKTVIEQRKLNLEETKRLEYFKSDDFIVNFSSKLPVRTSFRTSSVNTSYSDWLNIIFQTKFKGWREETLSPVPNQSQCERALGTTAQTTGICYLCGNLANGKNQSTMECEHILPIISALSHLWLIREARSAYNSLINHR